MSEVKFSYIIMKQVGNSEMWIRCESTIYREKAIQILKYKKTQFYSSNWKIKVELYKPLINSDYYINKIREKKANARFGKELAKILDSRRDELLSQEDGEKLIQLFESINQWETLPNIAEYDFCNIVNDHLKSEAELQYCNHCNAIKFKSVCDNTVDDDTVCDECYNETKVCRVCNCNFFPTGDEPVHYRATATRTLVCSSCQEDGCVPQDSECWFPYDDLTEVNNEWYYTPPEEEEINSYHKTKPRFIGSCFDCSETYIGIELEIKPICDDEFQLAHDLKEKCNSLRCERDSSITGFEIITGYGPIHIIKEQVSNICSILKDNALGHNAGTNYGLHVSVSRLAADHGNVEDKLLEIWNAIENEQFFLKFSRRMPTEHCTKNKKQINGKYDKENKYQIVRSDDERFEFRWFRSSTKFETVYACMLIAYCSLEYARMLVESNSNKVNYVHMMEWIQHNQPVYFQTINDYLKSKEGIRVRGIPSHSSWILQSMGRAT